MYKPLNEKYESIIYNETAEHQLRIMVDGIELDGNFVKSVSFDDEIFNEEQFSLGNACIGQITLTLYNEALKDLESYKEFYFEYNLMLDDTNKQVIPIGYFYSHEDDIDRTDDSSVKFILKDNMYDLETTTIDFSDKVNAGNFTRGDLVNLICETYNLKLMTPNFIGKDVLVNTYDNSLKVTSWLKFISERAGGFAKIGRNKDLYIKSFKNVDKIEIPTKCMGPFKNGELKTITGVCYKNATQNFTAGDNTGTMIYLSQDNYFACSQEEVDTLYEELVGLQFQTLEVTIWGDPAIDTGDLISVNGITTFAQKHWTYGNGFYGTYKCVLNVVGSVSGVQKISQGDRVRRIKNLVDEENLRIELMLEDIDENKENVTKLELDMGKISQSVSTVEKDLATTKSNLDSLSGKIDGVSADFNDFKDNEYIKSIDNLQDQIDGAIQFWNGSEIPTINNYPANEWATENDRNNHRADIYTVIEDVEGELKQGKSYRFDKVGDTWQWIELTDNELSAVQALAQQAMDKSNTNAENINKLSEKTTELEQTDSEIKASVTELNRQYEQDITIDKKVEGYPIVVEDAGAYNVEELKAYGNSEQDVTETSPSPDEPSEVRNVEPIENLFLYDFKDNISKNNNKTYSTTFENDTLTIKVLKDTIGNNIFSRFKINPKLLKNGKKYLISSTNVSGVVNSLYLQLRNKDGSSANLPMVNKIIYDDNYDLYVVRNVLGTGNVQLTAGMTATIKNIQVEEEKVHTYVPYGHWLKGKITGRNLINYDKPTNTLNGITFTHNEDNSITINGTATANISYLIDTKHITLPAGTYTLSSKNLLPKDCRLIIWHSVSTSLTSIGNNSTTQTTFTTNSEFSKYRFQIYIPNGTSINNLTIYPQLEEGNTATEYEPYKEKEFLYPMGKENLFDNEFKQGNLNGTNNSVRICNKNNLFLEDGIYTIVSNLPDTFNYAIYTNSNPFPSPVSSTYDSGWKIGSTNISFNGNNEYFGIIVEKRDRSNITPDDLKDFNFKLYKGDSLPYHELSKINETKDDLEFISGILNKKIGRIVLTGDENIEKVVESTCPLGYYFTFPINNNYNFTTREDIKVKSTHFKTTECRFVDFYENTISVSVNKNKIIFVLDDTYTDVTQVKQWLKDQYNAGTPVTIYYELETPEQYQLEPINIELFKGYNRITLEDKYGIVEEAELTYLTNSKLNGQYVNQSQLKLTADSITREVNKKVSTNDFNSTVSELNTKITETSEKIEQQVSAIYNLTIEGTTTNNELVVNNITQGSPLYIKIHPINENISYLYPNENLFPSDTTYITVRTLRFENTITSETFDYELPDDLLYLDNNTYDEFVFDYENKVCQITKKCDYKADGSVYKLSSQVIEKFNFPIILLTSGNYKISMLGYQSSYIYTKLVVQNNFTDLFATHIEANSIVKQTAEEISREVSKKIDDTEARALIKQTADGINQEVSKKVGEDEIISRINQSAEQVQIDANKISLEGKEINMTSDNINFVSNNFSVDREGNMSCNNANINGTISGSKITGSTITSGLITSLNYNLSNGLKIDLDNGKIETYSGISFLSNKEYFSTNINGGILETYHIYVQNDLDGSASGAGSIELYQGDVRCDRVVNNSLEEYKKNIKKFDNALSIIEKIDLYKYNLKSEKDNDKKHIGIVIGNNYNYSSEITVVDEIGKEIGVDTYSMTSLNTQAIKELLERIKALERKVENG